MRIILAALLLTLPLTPALAQKEPLQPAPVPGLDAGRPAPADRAGGTSGADAALPFSAVPTSPIANSGERTPSTQGLPDSRTNAPAPSTSK